MYPPSPSSMASGVAYLSLVSSSSSQTYLVSWGILCTAVAVVLAIVSPALTTLALTAHVASELPRLVQSAALQGLAVSLGPLGQAKGAVRRQRQRQKRADAELFSQL